MGVTCPQVLSGLRRERMVNSMFDDDETLSVYDFGLISTGNYWGEELMSLPGSSSEVFGDAPNNLVCSKLMALAIHVLGNKDIAKSWFQTPALGLSGIKSVDLLYCVEGTELVRDFLKRMQQGVYQ